MCKHETGHNNQLNLEGVVLNLEGVVLNYEQTTTVKKRKKKLQDE